MYSLIQKLFSNKKFSIITNILILVLYAFFTISNPAIREFNTDELWAWDIASDIGLFDILNLMKWEGHAFVWFFALKPFTYFDSLFPYILKIINWIVCFVSISIFLFFSPINKFLKVLIIFSLPFLLRFPIEGRCYCFGLLFLFLLCIFYKDRLQKPIIFSTLILLTANVSFMNTLGAFSFGCLFSYDLIKHYAFEKKNLSKIVVPFLILFFCAFLILYQWFNPLVPDYVTETNMIARRENFLRDFYFSMNYKFLTPYVAFILFFLIPVSTLIFLIKEKLKAIPYIIFALPTICFIHYFLHFIYPGHFTHAYFPYLYLIIIYWIFIERNKSNYKSLLSFKCLTVIVFLYSILFLPFLRYPGYWGEQISQYEETAFEIKKIVPKGSKIILHLDLGQGIVPFLKNYYDLRNASGEKIPSFDSYKNIYHQRYIPPSLIVPESENEYFLIKQQFFEVYKIPMVVEKDEMIDINGHFYLYKLKKINI